MSGFSELARAVDELPGRFVEVQARRERVPARVPGHVSELRPLRASLILLSIPSFAAQLRPVPDEYVTVSDAGDRVVSCPCGVETVVPFAELVSCVGECGRCFFGGHGVHVAGGPKAVSGSVGSAETASDG